MFRRGSWEGHFERTSDNGDDGLEFTVSQEGRVIVGFRFNTNWSDEETAPEWSFEQGVGPHLDAFIGQVWPELRELDGDLFRGRSACEEVDPTSTYVIGVIQEILRRLAELPDTMIAAS